jgi:hypothetical protein
MLEIGIPDRRRSDFSATLAACRRVPLIPCSGAESRRTTRRKGQSPVFVERSSTIERYRQPPLPKFGNECQPRTLFLLRSRAIYKCNFKSSNLQVQFTTAIYKRNLQLQFTSAIYNCNLQASLNHRANACSCFSKARHTFPIGSNKARRQH